jgi:uncharacterized protein YjeT (DUF2065 family)
MEPVAIVTLFVGVLYLAGRGGYVIAPRATADFYRRTVFHTDGSVRAFGGAMLVLVAVPLLVTVRQAPVAVGIIVVILKALGWLAATAGIWVVATPGVCRRLADRKLIDASDSALRSIGLISVAFGLFLAWNAFFVL